MLSDTPASIEEQGYLKLLEIKDSDIRITTLKQGVEAVDKGIHIGGAFSAVIPLVCLYYGGIVRPNVADPLQPGQDLFVLSKGHAVAALASIYADLGYFDSSVLKNSRSWESILNGHPGPLLPGIHLSTGPMGQGLAVAQGFALAGKGAPRFDVYCLTGDGEMQEGTIWEAVMYSGAKRLDNLCVIVDKNEGQLDNPRQLQFPMPNLHQQLAAFGWRVMDLDGTQYGPLLQALRAFRFQPRDGRPTAIVANTRKGWGGFSSFMVSHKVEIPDALAAQELEAQKHLRDQRAAELQEFWCFLGSN
ncbi:MAG TPA: thiamine pyrophosphate-dependent enzyme, partial [Spirochaetia bacterium]|nr:thiamine pyrophosphate-dependent enzyme [Spirochaetia bacterium]